MAYISDASFDLMLNDIRTNTEELHICSQEPTTYAEATSTYSLGQKTSPTIAVPSDKAGGGRECVVSAIADGVVDGTDDATHYALVKASATSRLLLTGALDTLQGVTSGNPFTLTEFAFGTADAVAS